MEELLMHFYALTSIPIRWFEYDEVIFQLGDAVYSQEYDEKARNQMESNNKTITCLFTKESLGYVRIQLREETQFLILGPVRLDEDVHNILLVLSVAFQMPVSEALWDYCEGLHLVQPFDLSAAVRVLCRSIAQKNLMNNDQVYYMTESTRTSMYSDETIAELNVLEERMSGDNVLLAILNGQPERLKDFEVNQLESIDYPRLSGMDQQRMWKNGLIGWASICARTAIMGGMDREMSVKAYYQILSNVERIRTMMEIQQEFFSVAMFFAEQVSMLKRGDEQSGMAGRVTAYVSANIDKKLTVGDIARHFHQNASYLGHRFKEETGKTISRLIQEQRIEACKKMLDMTDYSLSEIAWRMNFSSQQHFQTLFKKETGMTPLAYRERQRKHEQIVK